MIARLRTPGLVQALLLCLTLAVSSVGCSTKRSNPFDPDNPDKPDDVFELKVVPEGLALRLTWKALEQPVQEYRVYKVERLGDGVAEGQNGWGEPSDGAEIPETPYAVVSGSLSTLLDDAIIVGGAKYHYWVRAFHATYGESPESKVAVYDAMEDLDKDRHTEDDCIDNDAAVNPDATDLCDGKDNNCDGNIDEVAVDLDGDGAVSMDCAGGTDCNDGDSRVHPDAAEICDGKDNDCDGRVDAMDDDYAGNDSDGDGHDGALCGGDDCDDGDAMSYPGAAEICDGKDNNCDGTVPENELDRDGDGFKGCEGDCDDNEAAARPGAAEICGDGIDNDCDGSSDNVDLDGDGHVDRACGGDDCNDNVAAVNPSANEICGNGVDDNCNGDIDEQDSDGDGFDSAGCGGDDCDDNDGQVHPGATELCDGKDTDCDGGLPADEMDSDDDGVRLCDGDCHDFDPDVHPGADEICDGRDNDCNGETDEVPTDADQDGYVSSACPGGDDCDDGNADVNPGTAEVCGDSIDNDCSGAPDDLDADLDGYIAEACNGDDCDDGDAGINPGANEICDNTYDDNCNGQINEADSDNDGHDSDACGGDDCNDNDGTVYPGADEICDMQDNNCDGVVDENQADGDDDGHVDANCLGGTDCDDNDGNVRPGAAEQCGDEVDQDCSGDPNDKDADEDGHVDQACGGDDCNDNDNTISPDFREICGDTIDQDCSGDPDDKDIDEDGHFDAACDGGDDCDDDDGTAYPGAAEVCGDGADNDCNGTADDKDADGDSFIDSTCLGGTDCNDGDDSVYPGALDVCGDLIDQNCNGVIDDTDADGDGYLDDQCGGDDCDDDNINVNPGQNEDCSTPYDDNCNGTVNEGDADNDGHDSAACGGDDCDDNNDATYPGASEICDGKDNNCDTVVDEGCDDDDDGYCDATMPLVGEPAVCPDGGGDCDDGAPNINPGVLEVCGNGVDENCSGTLDDRDADDDGYIAEVCGGGDCNDGDAGTYPDAPEACDARDNDCDGQTDEDPTDLDNDGHISKKCGGGDDCDDFDPDVNPDEEEICDGKDNDCNGTIDDRDDDEDGFIAAACGGDDCDDSSAAINPAAVEICGNTTDEDCTGQVDDKDADHDGYKDANAVCGDDGDDCDDTNENVNPGQNEDCSTPEDDNCNGTVNEGDADGDGYDSAACGGRDCDDNDADVNPDAEEVCDGKDNNCNFLVDEIAVDNDGDGFISDVCGGGRDCDDSNENINPDAQEVCGNQVDEDCSGALDDLDADHDGYIDQACGGDDCDDRDDEVNPGEWEDCEDGKNNDCVGGADDLDADGDGHINPMCGGDDCDDFDPNTYPGASEVCDGRDNDCDDALSAAEQDGDGDGAAPCAEVSCDAMPRVLSITDSWTWNELREFLPVVSRNSVHVGIEQWDGTNPAPDGFDVVMFADGGRPAAPWGLAPRSFSKPGAKKLKAFVEAGGGLVLMELASLRQMFEGPQELVNLGLFNPGPINELWPQRYEWFLNAAAHPMAAGVPAEFLGPPMTVAVNAQARPGATVIYSAGPDGPASGAPLLLAGLRGQGRVAHFNVAGYDGADAEPLESREMFTLLTNALRWTNQCHAFKGNDCDDADPLVFPGAPEFCDTIDNDCDTLVDMADPDLQAAGGDGDGDGHVGMDCDVAGTDCDDTNAAVHPDAVEVCDTLDNDCDGAVDGDDNSGNPAASAPYYVGDDADGDGFDGPCGSTVVDCDDSNDSVFPGAPELCDGIDNDCDGLVDMADPDMQFATVPGDGDGDGTAGTLCGGTDCDDTDPTVGPHAAEVCGDGIDNDCSGRDGDKDADRDGYVDSDAACDNGDDCDDGDPDVNPGALDICNSGVDEDCSGAENDRDEDGDGEFALDCGGPDCDDTNPDVNSQAAEVCDGEDNNCDGQLAPQERDDDGDGFAECLTGCAFQPLPFIWAPLPHDDEFRLDELCGSTGQVQGMLLPFDFPLFDEPQDTVYVSTNGLAAFGWENAGSSVNTPIPSQGMPNGFVAPFWDDLYIDCTGGAGVYAGWGGTAPDRYLVVEWNDVRRNSRPERLTFELLLFENGSAWMSYSRLDPGSPEAGGASATIGIESADGRRGVQYSYNTDVLTAGTTLQLACGMDCDDTSDAVSPGAAEACNGEDTNCDGTLDNKDADYDGHIDDACTGGTDCDDDDFLVNPDAEEICGDAIDNDCSGDDGDKDADKDGHIDADPLCLNGDDCDDENPAFYPGATEICDGEDNNCDGQLGAIEQDDDGDGFAGCDIVCDRPPRVLVVADALSGPAMRDAITGHWGEEDSFPTVTTVSIGAWDTAATPAADFDVVVFADGGLFQNSPASTPLGQDAIAELVDFAAGGGGLVLFELTAPRQHRFGQEALAGLGLFTVSSSPAWATDAGMWTVVEGHPVTENLETNFWPSSSFRFRGVAPRPGTLTVVRNGDGDAAVVVRDGGAGGRTVHTNLAGHNDWWGFRPFNGDVNGRLLVDSIKWVHQCAAFRANDCDDTDEDAHPNAGEVCDGKDNDCDGYTDEINDGDHDGHKGVLCGGDDCDDGNDRVYAGAPEICDGVDNDCNGQTDEVADGDGDGYDGCDCNPTPPCDCDDGNPLINPGNQELCDGEDNDCDGLVDMDDPDLSSRFGDGDGDGIPGVLCGGSDCDDTDAAVYPNAAEVCGDGIDNDCSGLDGDKDADDDGYIDADPSCLDGDDCDDDEPTTHPGAPEVCGDAEDNDCDGTADNKDADEDGQVDEACGGQDCNDMNASVYVGAPEICDLQDNDCDGSLSGEETDDDEDGFVECEPGLVQVPFEWYPASGGPDMQGVGSGWLSFTMDFDFPFFGDSYEAPNIHTNGFVSFIDDSLWMDNQDIPFAPPPFTMLAPFWDDLQFGYGPDDGLFRGSGGSAPDRYHVFEWRHAQHEGWDTDLTFQVVLFEDGRFLFSYGDLIDNEGCEPASGGGGDGGDVEPGLGCIDFAHGGNATVGVQSFDGSRWAKWSYNQPRVWSGLTLTYVQGGDCDDADDTVYPGAPELCDGKDNDCDGEVDNKDADGDGHIDEACGGADCDDVDSEVNPDQDEICGNGKDDDCSGAEDDKDVDQDTYIDSACPGGDDCDDDDADRHPDATEQCNGEDDDCDDALGPLETDDDGDGYVECDLTGQRDPAILVLADALSGAPVQAALFNQGLTDTTVEQPGSWDLVANPASDFDVIVFADGMSNGTGFEIAFLGGDEVDALAQFAADGGGLVFFGRAMTDDPMYESALNSLMLFLPNYGTVFTNERWQVEPGALGHPVVQDLPTGFFDIYDVLVPSTIDSVAPDAQLLIRGTATQGVMARDDDVSPNRTVHVNMLGRHSSISIGDFNPFDDGNVQTLLGHAVRWTNTLGVFLGNDCDDADDTVYPGAPEICDTKDNDCDSLFDEDDPDFDGDLDGDTYIDEACGGQDCNDQDDAINPDAVEACDVIDNDCDDLIDLADPDVEDDLDNDSHIGTACGGDDCDDTNPLVYDGAPEFCDGLDNDCGGDIDEVTDGDGDSYDGCACTAGPPCDCNDNDDAINPDATEVCDDVDNDCDGQIDEGCDDDGDGYCDDGMTIVGTPAVCPSGGGDCDDSSAATNPDAAEICDGLDNDCDGGLPVDEQDPDGDGWLGCAPAPGTVRVLIIGEGGSGVAETDLAPILGSAGFLVQLSPVPFEAYAGENLSDKDVVVLAADIVLPPGGGWSYSPMPTGGRLALRNFTQAGGVLVALEPVGFDSPVTVWTDLLPCNPVGVVANLTQDTYRRAEAVTPAHEVLWTDLPLAFIADGPWFELSRDAGETIATGNPAGDAFVIDDAQRVIQFGIAGAVNDNGVELHPFAHSPALARALVNAVSYFTRPFGDDCADGDPAINPGAVDVCGDSTDNNCNGQTDETPDNDLDGEDDEACAGTDCDDLDHRINTTAQEYCDGIDNNCDTSVDEVTDGDGDGQDGLLCSGTDCDDTDPEVYLGAPEICDGKDNDCDGDIDEADSDFVADADGDTHDDAACGGDDCNDRDRFVFPGAPELCDGKDNDCDFSVDQNDGDFVGSDFDQDGEEGSCVGGNDCDDANRLVNSTAAEICDEQDNNCNGQVDEGFDTDSDPNNCGRCGTVCTGPHADWKCAGGECAIDACDSDYSNDNGITGDGCETYTCTPDGPEVCDEVDNDCDRFIDEEDDGILLEYTHSLHPNWGVRQLEIAGDRLLVPGDNGLSIYDVSSPSAPQWVADSWGGGGNTDVVGIGPMAIVSGYNDYGDGSLTVFGGDPLWALVQWPIAEGVHNAESLGPRMLLSSRTELNARVLSSWNISNPLAPLRLGKAEIPCVPNDLILSGDRAAVAGACGEVFVYDISGTGAPVSLGSLGVNGSGSHNRLATKDGVLYSLRTHGTEDLDVFTLWDLAAQPSVTVENYHYGMRVIGGDLLAIGSNGGADAKLWAYRLDEPTAPMLVGDAPLGRFSYPKKIAGAGDYVYVAEDGGYEIAVYRFVLKKAGTTCSAGLGECRTDGTWYCDPGGLQCDAMPGAPSPELCDGLDNDCDGQVDNKDSDGDGDSDGTCGGQDCDDDDPTVWGMYPYPPEVCDGKDNDCDMMVDSADPDFQGNDSDGDGVNGSCVGGNDCNDANPAVFPGAPELCNGIDDNCDTNIDEGFLLDTDPDNCGTCGRSCSGFQVAAGENLCSGGECIHNTGAPNGGCAAGWQDQNADPSDGCEVYVCTPTGAETCDAGGTDEDCNGDVNEDQANVDPITVMNIDLRTAEVQDIALDADRGLLFAIGQEDTPDVTFEIWDVSNPAAPVARGSLSSSELGSFAYNLAVDGGIAVASCDWYFATIDVSDPDNPTVLFQQDISAYSPWFGNIAMSAGFAYLPDDWANQLQVVDVRNPSSPRLVASVPPGGTSAPPANVTIDGDRVYLTTGDTSLHVFDIANPAKPVEVGSALVGENLFDVAVGGQMVHVTQYDGDYFTGLDLRSGSPQEPALYQINEDATHPYQQLAVDERFVYAAGDDSSAPYPGQAFVDVYTLSGLAQAGGAAHRIGRVSGITGFGNPLAREMLTDGQGLLYLATGWYPDAGVAIVRPNPEVWMWPCTAGLGECARTGEFDACGEGLECNATPGTPGPETCGDGLDNDCNGVPDDLDEDGDGFISPLCNGDDCCDSGSEGGIGCTPGAASSINPGQTETCNDVDDDCSGRADDDWDMDGDGHYRPEDCHGGDGDDCDDSDARIHGGAIEACDGVDNDCDGATDLGDPDLGGTALDISGWRLEQQIPTASFTFPPGTTVGAGTHIVIARDTTMTPFETCWGPLPPGTMLLDGGDAFPQIENLFMGTPFFQLHDLTRQLEETIPITPNEGRANQRHDAGSDPMNPASWSEVQPGAPGSVGTGDGTNGLTITQLAWEPSGYGPECQFVELFFDAPLGTDRDGDNDGHDGEFCGGDDCDDQRDDVFPGHTEDCDGVDNDCDGQGDPLDVCYFGQACAGPADCPRQMFCDTGQGGYCNLYCYASSYCPADNSCGAYTGIDADTLGQCTDNPTSNLPQGAACSGNGDCHSGFCEGGFCAATCAASRQCEPGTLCLMQDVRPDSREKAGVCGMAVGPGVHGDPCSAPSDCASNNCEDLGTGQMCMDLCCAAADCPAGNVCWHINYWGSYRTKTCIDATLLYPAFSPTKTLGEACTDGSECESALCQDFGSGPVCTTWCCDDSDCAQGSMDCITWSFGTGPDYFGAMCTPRPMSGGGS